MLPPFIIEQIRKREESERAMPQEQPRLEIPNVRPRPRTEPQRDEEGERGIVILEL